MLCYFFSHAHPEAVFEGTRFRGEFVAAAGLEHALAETREGDWSVQQLAAGPGDQPGLLVQHLGCAPLGYHAARQRWRNEGRFWIGQAGEVRAEPLARPRMAGGYAVELSGETWQVPILRRPDGSSELPQQVGWEGETYTERVAERYRRLWEDSAEVCEWFARGFEGIGRGHHPQILDFAVRALGVNYRFGRPEQNLLGVIDSANWASVLMAAVDWPAVMEAKKKVPDTPKAGPGGGGS